MTDRPAPVEINEIPADRVVPILRAAARHALLAAARDLGPEAMPPDGRIRWWLREPVQGSRTTLLLNPDPEYVKVEEHPDGTRTEHRYKGFTTPELEIWIAVDSAVTLTTAEIVAHEAFHRHRNALGIAHEDSEATAYASAYMARYWWVDGRPIGWAEGRALETIPPDP